MTECKDCKFSEPFDSFIPVGFDDDGNIKYRPYKGCCTYIMNDCIYFGYSASSEERVNGQTK